MTVHKSHSKQLLVALRSRNRYSSNGAILFTTLAPTTHIKVVSCAIGVGCGVDGGSHGADAEPEGVLSVEIR